MSIENLNKFIETGDYRYIAGETRGSILNLKGKRLNPVIRNEPKIGRNDPCLCGSGLKYKKCCGK